MPNQAVIESTGSQVEITDTEIDSILNLEDIEIKELQPTHFKLEHVVAEENPDSKRQIEILEDPEIKISFKEKSIDQAPIQIRKPTKDRAGRD